MMKRYEDELTEGVSVLVILWGAVGGLVLVTVIVVTVMRPALFGFERKADTELHLKEKK